MTIEEHDEGSPFRGVIGRSIYAPSPAWLRSRPARFATPNVLLIVLDDTGFGQLGCYGAPIRTPNIDRLALRGLLFNNMHTTALGSLSRASISNGRNHHANAMACITESEHPGNHGRVPFENGFLSEILRAQGFSTFAVGKWHMAPADETSAAGPFDRWPLGRGFERFYGFLGSSTNQYYPDLIADNHQVEPPRTPEQGYHLTEDLVDKAKQMIADTRQVAPDKPFFMYFCTGAMHAPHHVPAAWIDKYRGMFDDGWDVYRERTFERQIRRHIVPAGTKLSPRDPDVPVWKTLPADEKRLYARMMEVFAGFLEHTDHHIGRLLDFLAASGVLDNTLVMLISDNSASADGGPHGSPNEKLIFNDVPACVEDGLALLDELGGPKHHNHYPWGWAWAGATPFRRCKREMYRGGTAEPFIVHWPVGIPEGGRVRSQYTHVVDIVPTVLDVLGIEAPRQLGGYPQSAIHGASFAHLFSNASAPSRRRTQYFELFGHRAIYHDGWRAVCPVPGLALAELGTGVGEVLVTEDKLRELDAKGWELYNVEKDFSETFNVAAQYPTKLVEMISLWYAEAARYGVHPIDSRTAAPTADERPPGGGQRMRYRYYPSTGSVGSRSAPRTLNRPHTITARAEIAKGCEGVLLAQGGSCGGYSLFIKDHRLHYAYNYLGVKQLHVTSSIPVPEGPCELRFQFEPGAPSDIESGQGVPGKGQLFIDGTLAGEADLPLAIPIELGVSDGLTCGRDPGSVITDEYRGPFAFSGKLDHVTIDVSGERLEDHAAAMRNIMAHQ